MGDKVCAGRWTDFYALTPDYSVSSTVDFCCGIRLDGFAGKRFVVIAVEDIFFGRDPIKRVVDFHLILPISIYIITTIIY